MGNEEKVTAIDQLRMHIHDDTTFEAPDLEDLLAEIERLSAIEQEPIGYVTEAAAKLMREAKPGWHYHVIAADRSDKSATVAIYAGPAHGQ